MFRHIHPPGACDHRRVPLRDQAGGTPTLLDYGPFPRPWKSGWVAAVALAAAFPLSWAVSQIENARVGGTANGVIITLLCLVFAAFSLQEVFRNPTRIEIRVEGTRALLRPHWGPLSVGARALDFSEVVGVELRRTRISPRFAPRPPVVGAAIVVQNEDGSEQEVWKHPLPGEGVHAPIAEALAQHLGCSLQRSDS